MKSYYEIQQNEEDRVQGNDIVTVYKLGEYENNSVLSGQLYRRPVADFPSVEEAQKEYPQAESVEPYYFERATINSCDPDPQRTAECGEVW